MISVTATSCSAGLEVLVCIGEMLPNRNTVIRVIKLYYEATACSFWIPCAKRLAVKEKSPCTGGVTDLDEVALCYTMQGKEAYSALSWSTGMPLDNFPKQFS